mmetsp:Transcript_7099/g.8190  ORF Transcript_7099/g.8190 Transcript_7099/m.8190 type:complete len:479 (-) Transcript_7099:564-2000(-)|eukprot:CAMPEP_0197858746 /NCGR_PEP_ID=MMETSP1438-20131217/32771_1 /TAXON_ID=1461541 /ORGANISM="Pterosperma sp., Strain CCMP1384" /LENGTH=478 /DNA_ID=CAMNT_0043475003 /DNA_START=296 /DNA_END=1732 /DNA_ORIENTATION=+
MADEEIPAPDGTMEGNPEFMATNSSLNSTSSLHGTMHPTEWKGSTNTGVDKAAVSQMTARRGHHDSIAEMRAAQEFQDFSQKQVVDALKFQSGKTKTLIDDLQSTIAATIDNIKKLEAEKAKLDLLCASKIFMLEDCNKWLAFRSERPTRELVDDSVQQRLLALHKQLTVSIKKVQDEGIKEVEKALAQGQNYKALLIADLEDKNSHFSLDKKCLKELKAVHMDAPKITDLVKNAKHMELDWENKSRALMKSASDHVPFSKSRRAEISALSCKLEACESSRLNELRLALQAKIRETTELKLQLTKQLEVEQFEVDKSKKTIGDLDKAIEDKKQPLALAETRYETRKSRPDRELVDDKPERQLAQEVTALKDILNKLLKQKADMEAKVKAMMDDIALLEADRQDKKKSLDIDKSVAEAMVMKGEYDVIKLGSSDWQRVPTSKADYLEKTRASRTKYPGFMIEAKMDPPGAPAAKTPASP